VQGSPLFTSTGKLYGTSLEGGTDYAGVLFEVDLSTKVLTVKHSFTSATGKTPGAYLGLSQNGKIYGYAAIGGANNAGVIFEYDYVADNYVVVKHLLPGEVGGQIHIFLTQYPPSSQLISFHVTDKPFSTGSFQLTAMASSSLPVSYTSSDPSIASVSGSTVTIHNIGSTTITATQGGNNVFPAAAAERTLNITKDSQTIDFSATIAEKTFGDPDFELSATATSSLPVTFASSDTNVFTISGTTVTIVGAGTADITASQPGNDFFFSAPEVIKTVTIAKEDQTITFDELPARNISEQFTLSASSSSGMPVAFSSSSSQVTITGTDVITLDYGLVTITAKQAGNANYNAAPNKSQVLCIKPPKPTITYSPENGGELISQTTNNRWYRDDVLLVNLNSITMFTIAHPGIYKVQSQLSATCASDFSDPFEVVFTSANDVVTDGDALIVFPNPCSDKISIGWGNPGLGDLIIYSVLGQAIHRVNHVQATVVDTKDLPAGIYVVKGEKDGRTAMMRFAKE
jgi:hypothetical protein